MNKEQIDIQLIEACLLEKWLPMRNGTFEKLHQTTTGSCVLCQVYFLECINCPIGNATKRHNCNNSPYDLYCTTPTNSYDECFAIHLMCEFLQELRNNLASKEQNK